MRRGVAKGERLREEEPPEKKIEGKVLAGWIGQGAIPGSYDVALEGLKEALQTLFSGPAWGE